MKKKPIIFLCIKFLTAVFTVVFYISPLLAQSPSLVDYTAYPPFIGQVVPPNVLVILDNSGSMGEFAYKTPGKGDWAGNPDDSFNPSETYYGYFNPGIKYSYSTSSGGYFYPDPNGNWNGNFLNWLTMRRMDVVRKVLVGGKAINRANPGSAKYLLGLENPDRDFFKQVSNAENYIPAEFSGTRCFAVWNNGSYGGIFISGNSDGTCSNFDIFSPRTVKVEVGLEEPIGVVQRTWDKIRFGLMFFNRYGNKFEDDASGRDGGYIADWIVGPGANVNLVTHVENTDPDTWTPLGESFYEATRFFRAGTGAYQSANYAAQDPIQNWCQKNFVLMLTDGQSTKDRNIPGGAWGTTISDPDGFDVKTYMDIIASNEGYSSQWSEEVISGSGGTYYLEGVAYWAHITDFRKTMEGIQNITTYTVYAFDDTPVGKDLMQKTAKYGGFEDKNNNNIPDLQTEWARMGRKDKEGNVIPDTYFEASEGWLLEAAFLDALASILNRASSGTAVSLLTTTGEGEGAVYQAYFYPSRTVGYEELRWLGYLQGLFVDSYGNLREDTNGNKKLDSTDNDLIVKMWFDDTLKRNMIDRFIDVDGNGVLDCVDTNSDGRTDTCGVDQKLDTIFYDEVKSIWEAGSLLFSREPGTRKIYTTIDGSTLLSGDFTATNASTLRPYLRADNINLTGRIISHVRGTDYNSKFCSSTVTTSCTQNSDCPTGETCIQFRNRTLTIGGTTNTWKLGDIVYSSPVAVGKPSENFHIIYTDSTYGNAVGTFKERYKNRRNVVYIGANDGMLHAFNGGFYDTENLQFYDNTGHTLGEELWAFIPRDLLPHLKWLTDPNYTHVYYVDLKPRIADVRIFSADATHPGGWGTILIGGMRYGGKKMSVSDPSFPGGSMTFYSTYFALDITDPEQPPRLLWTFTDTSAPDDLGFTFSYPSVVRIKTDPSKSNSEDPGRWFVIFGSGPTAYNGTSTNTGKVYALNISGGTNGVIPDWSLNTNYWKFSTGDNNAFMADAIAVDVNRDYAHDAVYLGDAYKSGSNWLGKMFRLVTKSDPSPSNWALSTLFNAGKPITSSSSAAKDRKNNLWVFFGTGRYLDQSDKATTDQQAFYGIKDKCQPWIQDNYLCTTTMANLLDVTGAVVNVGGSTVGGVSGVTNWATLLGTIDQKDGWVLRFSIPGERDYIKPLIIGGLVVWATYLPSTDICSYEGDTFVYAVFYETGTAYYTYVFLEERFTQPGIVGRFKYLGRGALAGITGMVTKSGTLKGFAQTSTGVIRELILEPAERTYGFKGWKIGGIR